MVIRNIQKIIVLVDREEGGKDYIEKLGFKVFGKQFVEAGINHSKMIYER